MSDFSPKNPEYLEKCLGLLKLIFNIPDYKEKKLSFERYGGFGFFFHDLEDEVKEYREYIDYVEYMTKDEILSQHIDDVIGIEHIRLRQTAWSYIMFLIREQLFYHKNIFKFDNNKFMDSYEELEKFFYSDIINMRAVIKLVNFNCGVDEIELSKMVKIRKIDERDFTILSFRNPYEIYAEHIIEYFYEEKKMLGKIATEKPSQESYDKMRARKTKNDNVIQGILQTLRLFKKGNIISGDYFELQSPSIIGVASNRPPSYNTEAILFNPYELSNDEIKPFKIFYKELEKNYLYKHNEFSISLRRFNDALSRFRYDDKLIDMVIAFEALLFKGGENTELLYRLRLRTSKLLKKEYAERIMFKARLNEVYKMRSSIVHGEPYKLDPDLINDCEDILRETLKIYLTYRKKLTHEEIINRLDFHEIV